MWQMGIGPPYAKLYVQLIYDYLNTDMSFQILQEMNHIDVANYTCAPSIGTRGGI